MSLIFALTADRDVTMESNILMNPALDSPGKVLFLTHTKLIGFLLQPVRIILPVNVKNIL
jgi:hypothetical protein